MDKRINLTILVFFYTTYITIVRVYTKFAVRNLWWIFMRKKEKWTNKQNDKNGIILSYTIQQVKPNVCTNLQNPRSYTFWGNVDTNLPVSYIWVTDGKRKKEKDGKIYHSILLFFYIIEFKDLALIVAEKSIVNIFIREKDKRINNRGDWSWNIFYGHSLPSADSRRAVVSFWRKNVHNTG